MKRLIFPPKQKPSASDPEEDLPEIFDSQEATLYRRCIESVHKILLVNSTMRNISSLRGILPEVVYFDVVYPDRVEKKNSKVR